MSPSGRHELRELDNVSTSAELKKKATYRHHSDYCYKCDNKGRIPNRRTGSLYCEDLNPEFVNAEWKLEQETAEKDYARNVWFVLWRYADKATMMEKVTKCLADYKWLKSNPEKYNISSRDGHKCVNIMMSNGYVWSFDMMAPRARSTTCAFAIRLWKPKNKVGSDKFMGHRLWGIVE